MKEINLSVSLPSNNSNFFKKLYAFSGPGILVAVGYMDPGNWITSIQGGANYGYLLLSVILLSSIIAMLLQIMSAKLGIVTGLDLAQATKKLVNNNISIIIWFIIELAIISTEIAEIIGNAIALNLLFKLSIITSVFITIINTIILLNLIKYGIRKIEALTFVFILVIFSIFIYEISFTNYKLLDIIYSFIPKKEIFINSVVNNSAFFISLGILGATVMPHNLYLHSAIVKSRKYDRKNIKEIKDAIYYSIIDSNLQLSFSFIINCLLLIIGATFFFKKNVGDIGQLKQLYNALKDPNIVGEYISNSILSTLFAIALLLSGQNAALTSTMSGQIVMEGLLNFRVSLWKRRIVTILIAVLPIIIFILIFGNQEKQVEKLLIYTQIFLSVALPFSMIPLIYLTSSKEFMGNYVNNKLFTLIGWIVAISLILLNIQLVIYFLRN